MGQQQLLLLVLATVIVGLATVAGIQAFDENRRQAAADALQQKATTLTTDIKGLDSKPQQMGGLPEGLGVSKSKIGSRLGFENTEDDGTGTYYVPVPSAGEGSGTSGPHCKIHNTKTGQISIKCVGAGDYSGLDFYGVYDQDGTPQVSVQPTDPTN